MPDARQQQEEDDPSMLPLFFSISSNNNHQQGRIAAADDSSIIVDRTNGDSLLFQNAIHGEIVTSKLFPLIWNDNRRLRSIQYLQNLTSEHVQRMLLANEEEQVLQIGASLRDLTYLHSQGVVATDDQEQIIQTASEALGFCLLGSCEAKGVLVVTPWPTESHRVLRWIPATNFGDALSEELFLQNKEHLTMAFCSPDDLSYHNIENIIPMDSMFANMPPLSVSTSQELTGTPGKEILKFQLAPNDSLLQLTKWSSFAPPFNSDQRGGERMIFRSETLAAKLNDAVQDSLAAASTTSNLRYQFVNSVFRLNKFLPTDKGFDAHYDVPYYDSFHQQRSKYTLLLYLTPGQGSPSALRVSTQAFGGFEALEGVIFAQQHQHDGSPYMDGVKMFLRTELVCDVSREDEPFDEDIARMFNIACYHSIFHQELHEYATDLFNHSVACRFEPLARPSYKLHFRRANCNPYVTNGHDYWFPLAVDLQTCAVLAIMDYFNATYKLKKFRHVLDESHLIQDDLGHHDDRAIFAYLWAKFGSAVFFSEDMVNDVGLGCFDDLPVPPPCSCPILCEGCGAKGCVCPAEQNEENVDLFNELCGPLRGILAEFSAAIFDGTIRINLEDMTWTDTAIYFKSTGYQERVWFAACAVALQGWQEIIDNPVEEVKKDARLFHLPPIKYREIEGEGYHLVVDMFQNGWVDRSQLTFPVFRQQVGNVPRTMDEDG